MSAQSKLTNTQKRVIEATLEKCSTDQIASQLGISVHTVMLIQKSICTHLGTDTYVQAVLSCIDQNERAA